jgi:hypothetical protein
MICTNVRELLHESVSPRALQRIERALATSGISDIDGRMLAHEWIRTPAGLEKVDAIDHGADHFLPGPQNPAWDLAAAIVELGPTKAGVTRLLDGYARASGDRAGDRLSVYRAAYAALRAGYASMAAETLAGTPEARRFGAIQAYATSVLREALLELA